MKKATTRMAQAVAEQQQKLGSVVWLVSTDQRW